MFRLLRPNRILQKVSLAPRSPAQLRQALGKIAEEAKARSAASTAASDVIADKIVKLTIERVEARVEAASAHDIAQTLEERGLL